MAREPYDDGIEWDTFWPRDVTRRLEVGDRFDTDRGEVFVKWLEEHDDDVVIRVRLVDHPDP